jgi:hypothetical protein
MRDQPAESNGTAEAAASLQAEVEELWRRLAALEAGAPRHAARSRPTAKRLALLVAGAVLACATVVFGQGAVEALFVSKDGNVGVGTSIPKVKLDVNGSLHVGGLCGSSVPNSQGGYLSWNQLRCGTGETDFINHQGGGSGGFWFANTADGSSLTSLMFISGGGNVGIGTGMAEPTAKLEVAGRVKVKEIEFPDGGIQTGSLPARAVMAFNLSTCPAGWTEYAPARGRFVRGIDTTGSRDTDPDGRRQPGGTQDDAIRNITGSITGVLGGSGTAWPWGFHPGNSGAFSVARSRGEYNRYNGPYNPADGVGDTATFDASRVVRTAPENRPKNVALLYCEKQ